MNICELCNTSFTPGKPGRAKWCYDCKKIKRQEWNRETNIKRQEKRAANREGLVCTRCGLPMSARRLDAQYHQECRKAVQKEQMAAWEQEHRAERTARMRKHRGNENSSDIVRPLEEYICQTDGCNEIYLSQRVDSKYCDNCKRERRLKRTSIYKIKKVYGISSDEYIALLEKQDYKCALCRREFTCFPRFIDRKSEAKGLVPNVDHDHNTGDVRGLLCSWCNTDLARIESTDDWLNQATNYLKIN